MSDKPTLQGLISFYEDTLSSVGVKADETGLLSLEVMGAVQPLVIDDKRLVLPTSQIIRDGNWDDYMAFHPLCENFYRGESLVIKKLRNIINLRLTTAMLELINGLVTVCVSNKEGNAKLTPTQGKLLELIGKDADKKMIENFAKVLNKVSTVGENKLVNIYLKRSGKLNGRKYSRVAVVTFDVAEEFDNDNVIFGTKLRQKDMKAFKALFEYILPDFDEPNAYSYGTSSQDAPYFDALMNAYVKVATQLNKKLKMFKKFLTDFDNVFMNMDFTENMDDLSYYKDVIPTLEGNDGELSIDEKKKLDNAASENTTTRVGSNLMSEANAPVTKPVESPNPNQQIPTQTQGMGFNGSPTPTPQQPPQQQPPSNSGNGMTWSQLQQAKQQQMAQPQMQPQFQQQGFPVQPQQPTMTPPPWSDAAQQQPMQQQQPPQPYYMTRPQQQFAPQQQQFAPQMNNGFGSL